LESSFATDSYHSAQTIEGSRGGVTQVLGGRNGGTRLSESRNTDVSTKGLPAREIQAVVSAWQAGAISRETMTEMFRRGEVLPEGRSIEEEERLIAGEKSSAARCNQW
jgi:hypothetical protein